VTFSFNRAPADEEIEALDLLNNEQIDFQEKIYMLCEVQDCGVFLTAKEIRLMLSPDHLHRPFNSTDSRFKFASLNKISKKLNAKL
jgi:hypothetical protein